MVVTRNVLHGFSRGQKNKQLNKLPTLKNNAAAGYKGPVNLELLKGADLLQTDKNSVLASRFSAFTGHFG